MENNPYTQDATAMWRRMYNNLKKDYDTLKMKYDEVENELAMQKPITDHIQEGVQIRIDFIHQMGLEKMFYDYAEWRDQIGEK